MGRSSIVGKEVRKRRLVRENKIKEDMKVNRMRAGATILRCGASGSENRETGKKIRRKIETRAS